MTPCGPHVVFLGGFGSGNVGNDASLDVVSSLLSETAPRATVEIATPCTDAGAPVLGHPVLDIRSGITASRPYSPRLSRRLAHAVALEAASWWRAWRAIGRADVIVVPGTGILDDYGERPWGMPWALFTWAVLARARRTPLHLVGIGAGPIVDRTSRRLMVTAGRLASRRSFRDQASKDFLREHGVDTSHDQVTCDVVFARAHSTPPDADRTVRHIAIGVMAHGSWEHGSDGVEYERLVDVWAECARHFSAAGLTVSLLVGQSVDEIAVHDVLARLGGDAHRILVPTIRDYADLVEAVGAADLVIATRFHNVVAALSCARPVISLGYAEKNRHLLESVGCHDFAATTTDVTCAWVLDRVDAVVRGDGPDLRGLADAVSDLARVARADLRDALTTGTIPRSGNRLRTRRGRSRTAI